MSGPDQEAFIKMQEQASRIAELERENVELSESLAVEQSVSVKQDGLHAGIVKGYEQQLLDMREALSKSASRESALVEKLDAAYEAGWIAAAKWSGEDHLIADTDSKAYTEERDAALAKIKEAL